MYKRVKLSCYFKRGLRLFKGLCLLFLPNVPGAMFIPGATFIPESRVVKAYVNAFQKPLRSVHNHRSKQYITQKIPIGYSGKSLLKTSSDLTIILIRNHSIFRKCLKTSTSKLSPFCQRYVTK